MKTIIRLLKKEYAMKFVVNGYTAESATLIVLDRGTFDSGRAGFLSLGPEPPEWPKSTESPESPKSPESIDYDDDGAVVAFTLLGIRIKLSDRRDCG
ncbi:MAG: hypothetical protein HQK89_13335 [Nitrospirae bacterium]|nr:hypothetical protein [Nitrospirota bacterium]